MALTLTIFLRASRERRVPQPGRLVTQVPAAHVWVVDSDLTVSLDSLSLRYRLVVDASPMLNQIVWPSKPIRLFPIAAGIQTVPLFFLQKYWNHHIC